MHQEIKRRHGLIKKNRDRELKNRRGYFLSLIVTILFWGLFALLIVFADPDAQGSVLIFFCILSLALIFTFSLGLASKRRGILATLVVVIFLVLALFGVGTLLNLLLLTGAAVACEVYLKKTLD